MFDTQRLDCERENTNGGWEALGKLSAVQELSTVEQSS